MTPELEAAKSSRVVIVSVVVAAAAVTLLCLVGIAAILGLVGPRSEDPPAVAAVKLAQKNARAAPSVPLVAGETLVSPADPPAVAAPANAAPAAASTPPAASSADAAPAEPKPARPARKPRSESPKPARPAAPNYARNETLHPSDPGDPWPRKLVCRTCGTVTSIATLPDLWEVRVRLDDGASFNVRYPSPPGLRVGDKVRLTDGRLARE